MNRENGKFRIENIEVNNTCINQLKVNESIRGLGVYMFTKLHWYGQFLVINEKNETINNKAQ